MTTRKQGSRAMTMEEFHTFSGPGEPLEVLQARQEEDVKWAERVFSGLEPLGPPIRIQARPP